MPQYVFPIVLILKFVAIFALRSLKANRGYTFHQHYDKLGLINMNRPKGAHDNTAKINHRVGVTFGRVYDPVVGRFLSVDPVVGNPLSAQDYNGYSYCANNPMKYTDPSGYTYWQYKDGEWSHFDYNPFQGGTANFREAASGGSNLRYGYEGPGQGRNGTGLSGYYYDWSTGTYRTTGGIQVSWGQVYRKAVVPNALDWTIGGRKHIINQQDQNNREKFTAAISSNSFATSFSQSNGEDPNRETGCYFDNWNDFYNYMVAKANSESVEVAALAIFDPQQSLIIYWVQPWSENTKTLSINYIGEISTYFPNYTERNVISQFHTHPFVSGLSRSDALFSNSWNIPVVVINSDGSVWKGYYPHQYIVPIYPEYIPYGTKFRRK